MKKVLSLILVSIILITMATTVFADVLGDDEPTVIPGNKYNSAQDSTKNNTVVNNNKVNVSNNNSALPQTGIEDSGMGILLIVCVACAIFAYKKVSDYRNI